MALLDIDFVAGRVKLAYQTDSIKASFDQLTTKMDQIVGYAQKGFDGESLKAFQTANTNIIDQYKTMGCFLTHLADTLRKSDNELGSYDAELAHEVEAIFPRVVFSLD